MSTVKAIHDVLAATPALTSFLTVYQGAPAIFTRRPIPSGAEEPYVIVNAPVDVQSSGDLENPHFIQDEQRDIELIAPATGSVAAIDAAAAAMRLALANVLLTIPGYRRARATVLSGPRELPADSDSYGRLVVLNVHLVT